MFMYALGITSSIVTIPNWKGAEMYPNAPWELVLDTYLLASIPMLLAYGVSFLSRKNRGKVYSSILTVFRALTYLVMYPLYIIDTFCFVKFGTTLNPSMLLLAGETTSQESGEFFQSYVTTDLLMGPVGIMLLIAILHAVCALGWMRFKKSGRYKNLSHVTPSKYVSIAAGLLVVVGMTLLCSLTPSIENKELYCKTMSMKNIGDVEHSLAYRPHTEMYQPPMRLAFSIRCNKLIAQQLDVLIGHVGDVKVDSCSAKSPEIVLILGESFNKRHAQLYGYEKKNMPNQVRMEKEGRLTRLNDVVAPWNLTSFVFKHLMTTYCVGDEGEWCDYPLFCEVFRKAGYEVSFLTNQFLPQAKEAVYDFSGGFFINNDVLSKAQFDWRNNKLSVFDDNLLNFWDDREKNDTVEKKALHIFHLMGMHVSYRIRCPNRMKKWGAGDYPNDMDMPETRRKVLADYDNAVWYNDSVVNQIVERFKDSNAIVMYLPDHGEEVFGPGARHFFGRMHDAQVTKRLADEEFRIPMWIYTTPKYEALHPDVVAAVKAAANKRYMTDALSHMLMGLAGIHCPYYKPQYDLLSPLYNEARPRILKGQADYDKLK